MKKVGIIGIILLAGLIHGLLYVFLLPPWQHYDEPTHFEYAWLIANRTGLPSPGEYDQGMRREVAASMVEYSFFKYIKPLPDLLAQDEPVWIGISQTDNPPLYYWIAALPLRLVPTSDITFQLYLCRLISLIFYLVTILAAYGIVNELVPSNDLARWLIPATLILIPGFTELMTAVNSDVGAVAFFSTFLWASLLLIKRGFSIQRLLLAALLAVGCFFTKNTIAIALPFLVIALLVTLFRGRKQPIAWVLVAAGILVSIFLIFTSGDVAYWYKIGSQIKPTHVTSAQAPFGSYVFQIDNPGGGLTVNLVQLIPNNQVQSMRGNPVTLGYWIWSNRPLSQQAVSLKDDRQTYSDTVDISEIPTFHSFSAIIAPDTNYLQVIIRAPIKAGYVIFLDGLVLVKGDLNQSGTPILSDTGCRRGTWGDISFVNPIRNASAEQDLLRLRAPIQRWLSKFAPIQPNMIIGSLADWQHSWWYYLGTGIQLFRTFWGDFGWAHIPLSVNIYIVLGILTIMGLLGCLVRFWRNRRNMAWSILALSLIISAWIWGAALVRGLQSIIGTLFIPSARYAYPAIIPTVYGLYAGWTEWPRLFKRWLHMPRWLMIAVYCTSFLLFDILSVVTIMHYYGKL